MCHPWQNMQGYISRSGSPLSTRWYSAVASASREVAYRRFSSQLFSRWRRVLVMASG